MFVRQEMSDCFTRCSPKHFYGESANPGGCLLQQGSAHLDETCKQLIKMCHSLTVKGLLFPCSGDEFYQYLKLESQNGAPSSRPKACFEAVVLPDMCLEWMLYSHGSIADVVLEQLHSRAPHVHVRIHLSKCCK